VFSLIKFTIYSAEFGPKKKIGTFYRLIFFLGAIYFSRLTFFPSRRVLFPDYKFRTAAVQPNVLTTNLFDGMVDGILDFLEGGTVLERHRAVNR
jgi:hypothetical protein